MIFNKKLILFFVSSAVLLVIDGLYLYNIGMSTFKSNVELIQKAPLKANIYGAILSYVCVIGAFNYFIILQNKSPLDAFILGIFLYGVFDMTNITMFTNYSWKTAITDTLWGGTLFAFSAWVTYKLVAML
uniref:DUF2177 family protein n=1 Tax=viral metagenome TaxID=1070528 RepID=A0A6C0F148_9ZZZZ